MFNKTEATYNKIYQSFSKALGEYLVKLPEIPTDTTAVIVSFISVILDVVAKANKIALSHNKKELAIDNDRLAQMIAFVMTDTLKFSEEMKQALNAVIFVKLNSKKSDLN